MDYTLSYSAKNKGWPSFYSFFPEYLKGMNNFLYSWNKGNLYRHNTAIFRNNFYGQQSHSLVTGVMNIEPGTIKLFKTLSYEGSDSWECLDLHTDLNKGSMLATYFEKKEGEWFSFIRSNSDDLDFNRRSANGIGKNSIVATTPDIVITFAFDIGNIVSIGDVAYVGFTPDLVGTIIAVTSTSITVEAGATGGVIPTVGEFILFVKDSVAESHGARGYYMQFTLKNENTGVVELFSTGASVMKSYP